MTENTDGQTDHATVTHVPKEWHKFNTLSKIHSVVSQSQKVYVSLSLYLRYISKISANVCKYLIPQTFAKTLQTNEFRLLIHVPSVQ